MTQTELSPRAARRFLAGSPDPEVQVDHRSEERLAVLPNEADPLQPDSVATPGGLSGVGRANVPLEQFVARIAVKVGRWLWLATSDGGRATIMRATSHLVIIAVILGAAGFAAAAPSDRPVRAGQLPPSAGSDTNIVFAALPAATRNPSQPPEEEDLNLTGQGGPILIDQASISPMANPYTTIPNRERRGIIRYTVQAGDTLFGIAALYGLTPETLLWANYDELQDNPHLLKPGMVLNIPPVNGIVYVVQAGDTVEMLAATYKSTVEAIYVEGFEWNQLRPGQQPVTGATVIIPGGSREFKAWALSAAENSPSPSSSSSSGAIGSAPVANGTVGFCKDISGGLTGTGTFVWPTVNHWVSGNNYAPWHPGLDLAAHLGDPIMAADNGVVVYAGWNNWGYGNLVVLDHGNGWQTWYAHNSEIYVECGQNVFQGSTIAAAGSTGRSTGPHLHFETRLNGTLPNPFNVLPPP